MVRLFLAALLVGLLILIGTAMPTSGKSPDPVSKALDSSIMVYATVHVRGLPPVNENICSGTVIEQHGTEQQIATARHCVTSMEPGVSFQDTHVAYHDGDIGMVIHTVTSKIADIAVLTVVSAHGHPAVVTADSMALGEPLFVLGMPSHVPWTYAMAYARNGNTIFTGDLAELGPTRLIGCDECYQGDSGGGIFNLDGELLGIDNAGQIPDLPGAILSVPIQYALALLQQ